MYMGAELFENMTSASVFWGGEVVVMFGNGVTRERMGEGRVEMLVLVNTQRGN